jgi:CheY-like chemotaxis protein
VGAEQIGDHIVFSVTDTGIGIDPSQQDVLFAPFMQVENPHQKRLKGSGLGLSLTRALTELLGGKVVVESSLGVGSTFRAMIPCVYVERTRDSLAQIDPTRAVLIIDDDEIARFLLRSAIGAERAAFVEASSGMEGLRAAHDHRPRLIFLDLRMPNMDGYSVLDALKADPITRDIPVVIHTSQRLHPAELERLLPLTAAILDKEQIRTVPGRAEVDLILRGAGLPPTTA